MHRPRRTSVCAVLWTGLALSLCTLAGGGEPGAAYSDPADSEKAQQHWAFRPMQRPEPPQVADPAWVREPIDAFVLARLEDAGLAPSAEADKPTWIRRVTFNLIGLPPTSAEIEDFLADDSAGAHAKVVDRLLASPHYGEHQGRYWLDLVRYSDSNGLDENLALGNAWRYRDYVVRAFNADKPYDTFVREQLAGDLLEPAREREALLDQWIATGLLVLGPKMLAEQDKEKLAIDIVDEQIDVVSRTFMGLTVACARCHDHKFDPLPTRDYYALAGVFKSTRTMFHFDHVSLWNERALATPIEAASLEVYLESLRTVDADIRELEARGRDALGPAWRRDLARYLVAGTQALGEVVFVEAEDFVDSNLIADSTQWGVPELVVVRSDSSGEQFVEYEIALPRDGTYEVEVRYAAEEARPMRVLFNGELVRDQGLAQTTGGWSPGDQRWEPLLVARGQAGANRLRLERDGAIPHIDQLVLIERADAEVAASWPADIAAEAQLVPVLVRQWAAYLSSAKRRGDPVFAAWHALADLPRERFREQAAERIANLRRLSEGGERKVAPLVAGLLDGPAPGSLAEWAARYQVVFSVIDGLWRAAKTDQPELERLASDDEEALRRVLYASFGPLHVADDVAEALYPPALAEELGERRRARESVHALEPPPYGSALSVSDGEARDLPVHIRGSHLNLASEGVPRGFLSVLDDCVEPPRIPEAASGRRELADWLVDGEHPLTARVIANRVWAVHFGVGLVASPSNFGLRGAPPSHPELLDWLARDLVASGWSLKALHRRIALSSTYRMDSRFDAASAAIDPQNRWLWRMNRRRLRAESIRDAVLAVSGQLDPSIGGSLLKTPNAGYVTNDQSNNQARYAEPRRSIYLPVIRNAMYDMFSTFDYNDPSVHLSWRPSTVVAHQALWLLNSPFVLEASRAFAEQILGAALESDGARIELAYERAFGRPPTAREIERGLELVDQLGLLTSLDAESSESSAGGRSDPIAARSDARLEAWQEFCQTLFACNEFVYVD